ncbi:F-box/WD repeat-containing protein 12 [Ochotona curzoniae]|uniref:F-box/WD repeat-containing protein 12 n=1 Tax=Ochotona curzoniae TaxID=130825 RepID=UPI001B346070|nr:F-box/WD repeat-containing protein 12 [Ochotona curzoniae]
MEFQLPELPLSQIFSFLDSFSLLQAAQVNKQWRTVANSNQLWKRLYVWRWPDSKLSCGCDGLVKEWKKSYLRMTRHERQMTLAKADDFSYKEASEEEGTMGLTAYVWKNDPEIVGMTPVICSVSSIKRLYAWDVQTVGDITGDIYTFTLPDLTQISKVKAFQFRVDVLLCSPHKQWMFACGLQQHTFSRAKWIPNRDSKIVLMYQRIPKKIGLMTLSLTTKKIGKKTNVEAREVGNFLLPDHIDSSNWMGVSEEELIVLGSGPYLFIFTTNGFLLRQVDDHLTGIMHLRVDHIRVLATTMDGTLHLYVWEEGGRYPYLKKCCELKFVSSNFTLDRYFYDVICDNDSIVRVVSSETTGFSILMLYTLKTSLQS